VSTAYTECSIRCVQQTPSAAHVEYHIQWIHHALSTVYNVYSVYVRFTPSLQSENFKLPAEHDVSILFNSVQIDRHQAAVLESLKVETTYYIPIIGGWLLNHYSDRTNYGFQSTESRSTTFKYSHNFWWSWSTSASANWLNCCVQECF